MPSNVRGMKVAVVVSALLLDALIYVTFRDSPHIRPDTLLAFTAINVPLLLADLALSWWAGPTPPRWVHACCLVIEIFTTVVWIQVTGSVSSYFLLLIPVLVMVYRLFTGYWMGLLAVASGMAFHLGAFGLEELGLVKHAGLFTADPGAIYTAPVFRIAALLSIQMVFFASFSLANLMAVALVEKDQALGEAQRDLERAEEELKPGRLTGQTLAGRYKLSELLGRGGMGEVYRGRRQSDGREVAVKVLYGHFSNDSAVLERFRREAEVASRLPREQVAEVLELGHADGQHFLAMEYLPGEDLGALLRRREKLPPAELLPILEQLTHVLAAAHAAGIVHRDLKPQNVFLSSQPGGAPRVRLLDFGISKLRGDPGLTTTSALLGSPGYLAPEQAAADLGPVGPEADLFALGALIYRALTGQSAFPSRHPAAAVYEAVHVTPAPPTRLAPELPADVDHVLSVALAKKPSERYRSPLELMRDLEAALGPGLDDSVRRRASDLAAHAAPEHTLTSHLQDHG
jgi:serine/threonine-protein kinase